MLKGINKQIIEIKCTNSEHFEKILLFIKNDNGYVPVSHLGAEIYEYYSSLMGDESQPKGRRKRLKIKEWWVFLAFFMSGLLGLLAVMLIL